MWHIYAGKGVCVCCTCYSSRRWVLLRKCETTSCENILLFQILQLQDFYLTTHCACTPQNNTHTVFNLTVGCLGFTHPCSTLCSVDACLVAMTTVPPPKKKKKCDNDHSSYRFDYLIYIPLFTVRNENIQHTLEVK